MRKILLILIFIFIEGFSQGVLPVNRYKVNTPILDLSPAGSTFAYSLRKLKSNYSGFCIRVRNVTNGSTADISFDNNDLVSNNSNAIIVTKGTGSYNVGQNITLATFKSTNNISVSIWYNQNTSGFNAIQTNVANQPILDLTGGSNSLPTILFFGTSGSDSKSLIVQSNVNNILPNGLGSFLMVSKPTSNIAQSSFGYLDTNNWRWSFHLNWSDANLYFDGAEICCQGNRAIANGANINIWRQYSFIRGSSTKSIRINTSASLDNSPSITATQSPSNGFGFGIGLSITQGSAGGGTGFQGSISEIIMFQRNLTNVEITPLELNQMNFWKL